MLAVEIVVGVIGAFVVLAVLGSATRTVVVPRGEQVFLSRLVFGLMARLFGAVADHRKTFADRDAVMARFAPVALVVLPLMWAVSIIAGFTAVFWAAGVRPVQDAFVLSGSSLTTLGFRSTEGLGTLTVSILEGLIGLGLIALLISFLPTIYSAFSSREKAVTRLYLRASQDGVASSETLLRRTGLVGGLDQMTEVWREWDDWFVEVEENHTSFPMLVFFRSPVPERSWITAAGMALDAAAFHLSTIETEDEHRPRPALMLLTGTRALRRIAVFFNYQFDPDPAPTDPISISRAEFDAVYDRLGAAGIDLKPDRDQCWRDFAGWRVNYDAPLLALCSLVGPPPTTWSSDRATATGGPTIFRKRTS